MAQKLGNVLAASNPPQGSTTTSALAFRPGHSPRIREHVFRTWEYLGEHRRAQIREVLKGEKPWPLVLWGSAGTGKTCAALSVTDGVSGSRIYCPVQELVDGLVAMQQDRGGFMWFRNDIDFWREWDRALLTVIDELGTRQASDFHYATVKRAIDRREGKPAIFISNCPIPELADLYDERIASRLAAGTVLEFSGEDFRVAGKEVPA